MKSLTLALAAVVAVARADVTPLFTKGILTEQKAINIFADGSLEEVVMHGGKQEGSLVLKVVTPGIEAYISPSRGLNIMNATAKGADAASSLFLGWNNPVQGVVNPAYVNLMGRDGSGFLDGFNEMMARCGFEWAGHAGYDGDDFLTLHGLAANTPVSEVGYEIVDDDKVRIYGTIELNTFKKSSFKVTTVMTFHKDSAIIDIEDTLQNLGDYPAEYMAIYHSNFGSPILEKDSKLYIPTEEVSPFDAPALALLDEWSALQEPRKDYDETVYNLKTYANAQNRTLAVMTNAAGSRGIAVRWRMTELPVFGLWKNLDTAGTGYVVGLEPGTSYSYNRRWNRDIGLVPTLPAGDKVTFAVTFQPALTAEQVTVLKQEVETIQGDRETKVTKRPLSMQEEPNKDGAVRTLLATLVTPAVLYAFTL